MGRGHSGDDRYSTIPNAPALRANRYIAANVFPRIGRTGGGKCARSLQFGAGMFHWRRISLNFATWYLLVSMGALAAWGQVRPTIDSQRLDREPTDRVVKETYRLQHKSPTDAARVLAPLLRDAPHSRVDVDIPSRSLIVSGPAWVQQCAREVVTTLDQPPSKDVSSGSAASPPRTVAYRLGSIPRAAWERQLAELPEGATATVSYDSDSGTAFVRASDTAQSLLSRWLAQQREAPESGGNSTTQRFLPFRRLPAAAMEDRAGDDAAFGRRFVPVTASEFAVVRRELLQLLGSRLHESSEPDSLILPTKAGDCRIHCDFRHKEFMIEGPVTVLDQLQRLLESLDEQSVSGGSKRSQVVPLHRDTQPRLREVIRPSPGSAPKPTHPESVKQSQRRKPGRYSVDQATYLRRPDDPVNVLPADNPPPNPAADADDPERDPNKNAGKAQFEGVELELLPDLDAVILRGRDQELRQLADIIRQLEELSRETQPAIQVVELRFTSAQRVSTIIQQTQANLIGTRQGRATVTNLGTPNALLVIGWGEAVRALVELIEKLDQPIESGMQFDVVQLRHATAAAVQQTLQGFYNGRQGLGPSIQSTADARTNSIVVHAAPRDMTEVRRLVERLDVPQAEAIQRARVFPIQHSLAADIAQMLQQATQPPATGGRSAALELMLENGDPIVASGILENTQITVNARNNSLIITAPPANFPLLENLIRQLDTPGLIAKIKIFPIQHGDASTLIETLRSLIPSQAGASAGPQLSSAPGESSLAPLRFTVDARSNSLIATGSEGDLRIVEALIVRLDENDSMQRRSTVYQLKNSAAVDVALTINEFLRTNRLVESAGPGRSSPFQQLEKEVVVVPEPVANKLILSATPRYYDEISRLIEQLDQQPPQVMIQVLIAEVALSDAEEFGVELGIQDSVLFDRSLLGNLVSTTNTNQTSTPAGILTQTQQTVIAASNQPGFDFNSTRPLGNSGSAQSLSTSNSVGGQGLSNFDLGRGSAELGFGGLVLSASSQNLSVLMRALRENRRLEVLSRPQVLTLDNQPAFIQVGQRVPRIVGSIVNQAGQQNNVALENVGLILGVTPRISPDGNVVMEIDAEKSELGTETEGIPVSVSTNGTVIRSPRINTTTAQATVSAASGETIILGGLITKSTRNLQRKVPYLGDVPLLGNLFRYDSQAQRRTELLIILTPHVVRTPDDEQRLKQIELARMSWCAADIFDIHGDLGTGSALDAAPLDNGDYEIVYPDVDPRGRPSSRRVNGGNGR
ncbi:MAG: hypothetical protein FJ295_20410 [Planctomycetes bacterium]|nr:hypothetical protein [Planctomycetota bacterium]